jgi:hypothetical protein
MATNSDGCWSTKRCMLVRTCLGVRTLPYFFAALSFAHLARCAAAILRRADADLVRLALAAPALALAVLFAHRAFCVRLILLRADADRARLGFVAKRLPLNLPRTDRAASTCLSSFVRFVLFDLNCERRMPIPLELPCVPPRLEIVMN